MAAKIKKGQGEKNAKAQGFKNHRSVPACSRHDNGHSRMQFQHSEQFPSQQYAGELERAKQQHPVVYSDAGTQEHKHHQRNLVPQRILKHPRGYTCGSQQTH